MSNTRIERDSMGELRVPEAALYGAPPGRQKSVVKNPEMLKKLMV